VLDEGKVAERYRLLAPHLSERELACWAAAEGLVAGRGGVAAVSRATGFASAMLRRVCRELRARPEAGS
jgi:hypothetical protein